jgi:D-alanyl-D-alanine carboxypeptidase
MQPEDKPGMVSDEQKTPAAVTHAAAAPDHEILPTPTLYTTLKPIPTTQSHNLPTPEITRIATAALENRDRNEVNERGSMADQAEIRTLVDCTERLPGSGLFSVVTLDYAISRDAEPSDLVRLSDHLPFSVTQGYPSEVRQVVLQPLVDMVNDMIDAGLNPQILSGYRSYAAQAIAWNKWNTLYPERASIISAPPGHSEHQLGTVVDFGSPELPGIVGQPGIQFHTYFYKTSEGQWLAENAHKYGFTMSYTLEAFDTTGFYYEPWHFRYVGEEMATMLKVQELTFTEYQLANEPPPCNP